MDENPIFSMDADSPKTSFFVNAAVTLIVGAILYFILFIRRITSSYAYFIILAIIIAYQAMDFLIWYNKGIRRIEVREKRIVLFTGKEMKKQEVAVSDIKNVNLFRKVNRVTVNFLFEGGQAHRAPGVTLFSGKRLRITNDRFNDKEFDKFLETLNSIIETDQRNG